MGDIAGHTAGPSDFIALFTKSTRYHFVQFITYIRSMVIRPCSAALLKQKEILHPLWQDKRISATCIEWE